MSKKVLVLNGSPRKNGNTARLIDSFTKGAQAGGNEVMRFDLHQMDIHNCIGCLKGGKDKSSPCTQKDDMDKIYPVYQEADIVVLASPLYYWSFTAQLKGVIDRLFAVMEALGSSPQKQCMMIIAAEDTSDENFVPIVDYYKTLVKELKWQDLGMVLAGGVYEVGDIEGKPTLAQAEKLGAAIG